MDAMVAVLKEVPGDPMTPEWIGIQSRGMKQWISTQIAQKLGICANLSFLFPRQILEQVFSSFETEKSLLLTEDILMWSIMDNILKNQSGLNSTGLNNSGFTSKSKSCFSDLERYIQDDASGRKLFQLSMKIARVFDDYQIYRPNMLLDWNKADGKESFKDPVMAWQSVIWRQVSQSHTNMATRMDEFLKQAALDRAGKGKPGYLPGRICLFGVSAMPARFLDVFAALAYTMDIYLFLLTPSNQFFFDIKSQRQMEKIVLDSSAGINSDQAYYEIANPLLASLGLSGRDFHGTLEEFDYHEPFEDLFQDPMLQDPMPQDLINQNTIDQNTIDLSQSMLSVLQSDILNLVYRSPGTDYPPLAVSEKDWSINIHACHSPMREAQVLKDLLLDAFEKDPDLCPHDVIVMMPDIEAYAPYVEAVFSSEHKIPFAISDRRKKSESLSLEAFLKIIQLKDSRLEQARVLDLLRSPVISGRFDITGEDLFIMEEKLSNAKVLWGRDSDHRKELTGKGFIENTWKFGFQRLFMGYALPEGEETLVANVLPCDAFEGLDADILGKFAHFCHTLFAILRKLGSRKNIKEWGKCFKTLVQSMIEKKHTNESDMEFLIQTIDEFVRDGEAAGFAHEIDFSVAKEFIEIKLDKTFAQGSFLAGSLTFCNLMPMRSIPFKVVALMGMDESAFPRKTRADGFDLIKKHPQKGDKQERQEDRYLFLESLLSARNRLIITYTGMSIRDNSPIPCSGVVEELKDAIASSFEFPKGYTWSFTHPLHPFSPIYFKPSKPHQPDSNQPNSNQPNLNPINSNQPGFFSFSQDQCKIAISQANIENKDKTDLFPGYFPDGFVLDQKKEDKTANLTLMNVTLDNLVWFFRNPVEAFVTKGLNLSFPQVEEQSPDREVFQVSGLSGYGLGSYYMENQSGQDLFPLVRAGGLLPFGQKGKSEWDRVAQLADPVMELANTMVPPNILPPFTVDTQVLGLRITGSIKDIYQDGRYVKGFGRLNPGRLLTQWIYHLFYQAAIQDLNFCGASAQDQVMDSCKNFSLKPTHLIGQDPKGKIPAVVYSFAPIPNAFDYITDLISLYQKGQHQVLAFFCETCFHLAESLGRNNYEITRENLAIALQQSRRFWFDRFRKTGESLNRNISLVFGQKDPFENLESLVKSGIVENALAIYQPLFENLTCKS